MKYVDNSSGIRDSLERWGASIVIIGGIAFRRRGGKRSRGRILISEEGGVTDA